MRTDDTSAIIWIDGKTRDAGTLLIGSSFRRTIAGGRGDASGNSHRLTETEQGDAVRANRGGESARWPPR